MLESMAAPFVISPPERRELMKMGNSRRARSEEGRRARIILDLGRGLSLRDYTPTYSSWLNQVEIWFSKIQRDLIARGIFESRNDLKPKIMRYIRCHNANAKPFKWTYRNAAHRIIP